MEKQNTPEGARAGLRSNGVGLVLASRAGTKGDMIRKLRFGLDEETTSSRLPAGRRAANSLVTAEEALRCHAPTLVPARGRIKIKAG